jgi:hypothetical protein
VPVHFLLCQFLANNEFQPAVHKVIRPRRPGFDPRLGHVQFTVDSVAWGQVFSEYFLLRCQFSFRHLLHIHQSHYLRRYAVSILTASLSSQLKKAENCSYSWFSSCIPFL